MAEDDEAGMSDSEEGKTRLKRQKKPHILANYTSFYSRMHKFFVTNMYTDVDIVCRDQQVFKCHRLVLAAASEYFERMFYGCFKERHGEKVTLQDIDGPIFKEILRFAYEGDVLIDDENVSTLLHASEVLNLHFIQNQCVRYLTERNIPMHDAIQIFLFACITQKDSLIPTLCGFILKHLNILRHREEFSKISFEELCKLLKYFPPSSSRKEEILLSTICQWLSRSTTKSKKQSFNTLTQNIKFQYISAEYIAEYFDKYFYDGYNENYYNKNNHENWKEGQSDINSDLNIERTNLYAYIKTPKYGALNTSGDEITEVLKLQKLNGKIDWYTSHVVQPICRMRTVAFEDRIYSWKSQFGKNTFSVCSSSDLSSNMRLLQPPPLSTIYPMCGDQNKIYAIQPCKTFHSKLFIYNCELDNWSIMSKKDIVPSTIVTHTDGRLYQIGIKFKDGRYVRAYDHRSGKWEKLTNAKRRQYCADPYDECCSHKEKIYLSCLSADDHTILDVYDPRAGKLDTMQLLRSNEDYYFHRFISYDNQLWVFYYDSQGEISTQIYDSFLQEWKLSPALNCKVVSKFDRDPPVYYPNNFSIVDANVFKF